jgi:hypothetical protein
MQAQQTWMHAFMLSCMLALLQAQIESLIAPVHCMCARHAALPCSSTVETILRMQDYGFHASVPISHGDPMFTHSLNTSAVTRYASAYIQFSGQSPFAKGARSAGSARKAAPGKGH